MTGRWPKSRLAEAVRSIVFFGLLFLYVWLVVQPALIYSCGTVTNFPAFYKDWPFFQECLSRPGGLLHYLCALLPQFFCLSWAGALVITGQAWAFALGTGWLLRLLNVPGRRLLRFIPALLVVVPYAQYLYHFPMITGALASLLFGCLYVALARTEAIGCAGQTVGWCAQHTLRAATGLVLLIGAYVIGGAACLPFAALCALYELLYRRRYAVGVVCLLVGAVLPYLVGVRVFHGSIVDAYTDLLPLSWRIWGPREKMITVVYVLYLFPVVSILAWRLWQVAATGWTSRRSPGPVRSREKPSHASAATRSAVRRVRRPAVVWGMESVLLLAGGGAVAALSPDPAQKALLAVHYYACRRMWPQVLQLARRCGDNYTVVNAVDRALYHTGRLGRDMFTFLQHADGLVLTGEDHALLYWHKFDTLIDLGLLNLAEKNFSECVEIFGEHPMILQRLALIHLAKGKVAAAQIYLERLRKTLFFSGWASDYLARLAADPTLAGDPQMRQWRTQALRKELHPGHFFAPEPLLSALAEQGSQNRMAFEYLMAWYMVTNHLDRLVQNLGRLTEFGYTEIPPLYQEAAVIYAYPTGKPVPLRNLAISPEAPRRFQDFSRIARKYGGNKEAAFGELARTYGGSYLLFYFYTFASAPK
jgi:hypothetical protein